MSRRRAALVAALAAGCSAAPQHRPSELPDQVADGDRDPRELALAELRSEILESYQRDEVPDAQTQMLPGVGPARIGAGPGDYLIGQELGNAASRWPLTLDPTAETWARSKSLQLTASADGSAAWMFDEVSWRIAACDRTLVIPLRITALYVLDGDRWIPAVEHVSWGAPPSDAPVLGRNVPSGAAEPELDTELAASIAPLLAAPIPESSLLDPSEGGLLVGPQWAQEWHGKEIFGKSLLGRALEIEDGRAGIVGTSGKDATVAYWVGNLRGTSKPQVRLRATFVLERRELEVQGQRRKMWVVVQGHVSAPVDDEHLAKAVVGSALSGLNPLRLVCESSSGPTSTSGANDSDGTERAEPSGD